MTKIRRFVATLALTGLVAVPAAVVYAQPAAASAADPQSTMGGNGRQTAMGAEMGFIQELMMHHDRIRRTVTNLPDGIRTVTESDDPALAATIREHVAQMNARVAAANDPGMPMESPALHTIIQNGRTVTTRIETTPTGVAVVQTSTDPQTVRALQQHALEVTDLVNRGMAAMHEAMMTAMHGSMMADNGGGAMPPHSMPADQDAAMKQHGNMAMGFDQDAATHHFTLTRDGGVIAVSANDAADRATRDAIQMHLKEIAASFARGDFEKPLMTHGEVPPGVAGMQRHKSAITYRYEGNDQGGLVRIATTNVDALDAIHDFLRYQIKEHATGDPVEVQN